MVVVNTVPGEHLDLSFVSVDLQPLSVEFCLHEVLALQGVLLEVLHAAFASKHRTNGVEQRDIVIKGSLQGLQFEAGLLDTVCEVEVVVAIGVEGVEHNVDLHVELQVL